MQFNNICYHFAFSIITVKIEIPYVEENSIEILSSNAYSNGRFSLAVIPMDTENCCNKEGTINIQTTNEKR